MPQSHSLPTQFAPAERADQQTILEQADYFSRLDLLSPLLNAVPDSVMVLNQERQIVYANDTFFAAAGANDGAHILGQRVGEALQCEYAIETPGGCGTSENCRHCGAVLSILEAQAGRKTSAECQISVRDASQEIKAFDLRVSATPLKFEGEPYTVFAASDISGEKRRSILERIFFHDIINTASAIHGLVELLSLAENPQELQELGFEQMLAQASTQLLDEIQAQKQIMAAERGELEAEPAPLATNQFLSRLAQLYSKHNVAVEKQIRLDPQLDDVEIETDGALLGRVIGNMIKNALEASAPGDTVTVGCEQIYDFVRFWIHNDSYIPRRVQLQLFKRSFSTKGKGRGLGTYSMKLLSENYLQGRVSFSSEEGKGTIFMGMYPVHWSRKPLPSAA